MEPTSSLQRRRSRDWDPDWTKCLFCQNSYPPGQKLGHVPTHVATRDGIDRMVNVALQRMKYHDVQYVDVCEFVEQHRDGLPVDLIWHRTCYSNFTNATLISRLKNKYEKQDRAKELMNAETPRSSRSVTQRMDWSMCIFCQESSTSNLHNIQCIPTSNKIQSLANTDSTMKCRLASTHDLIAAEGKYHLTCYARFLRNQDKDSIDDYDPRAECFLTVMKELRCGLARGYIFSLQTVWNRYVEKLAEMSCDSGVYHSNRFKDKIQAYLGEQVQIVQPLNKNESMLLFPAVATDVAFNSMQKNTEVTSDKESSKTTTMKDCDNELLTWLFRVAMKIRADIESTEGHKCVGLLTQDSAQKTVPDSLYILLNLLCGDRVDEDTIVAGNTVEKDSISTKILSIAQDIVFLMSRGHKLTPKHIGLGLAVHQATRSKELVQLLHAAGHTISYDTVLRLDTAIAEDTLSRYEDHSHTVIPRSFSNTPLPGYIRFANDNIDINEETLDGKGTFHASQTAAFRRKTETTSSTTSGISLDHGRSRSVQVPQSFTDMKTAHMEATKPESSFKHAPELTWYKPDLDETRKAAALDLVWILARMENDVEKIVPSWSGFNQAISAINPPETVIGHLPIINAPAHEYDTIWTVINRCMDMSRLLQQPYTVITFDEQLYCKAKMLQWNYQAECKNVVMMLGGFHVQMNFAKVIGEHMVDSGLTDIWVESGVYGETTADNIMKGKMWNRVIRAHKLTFEALSQLKWQAFLEWMEEEDKVYVNDVMLTVEEIKKKFKQKDLEQIDILDGDMLQKIPGLQSLLSKFDENRCAKNATLGYWQQYMDLVGILLRYTRAIRDGNWQLYLSSFAEMLPWFAVYDHVHYTRWGTVFLADMKQLHHTAPEVHQGFLDGDFVVKETKQRFNQIPDDQGLEHVNKMGKVAGGLIGITRNDSARNRWGLTYNERSSLTQDTYSMLGVQPESDREKIAHKDCGSTRIFRDKEDVKKLSAQFEFFKPDTSELINLTTGVAAPEDVKEDLLQAKEKGLTVLEDFVNRRLITKTVSLHASIPRIKSKTFVDINKLPVSSEKIKSSAYKANRDFFQKVIVAIEAGRELDIDNILQQELASVPLSLATPDGRLRQADKAQLGTILQEGCTQQHAPESSLPTCTIIDGMALVQAIGKPDEAKTFGDLSDVVKSTVLSKFSNDCKRVDIVFDRYEEYSVKNATRCKRAGNERPIRTIIDSANIMLPVNWKKFIALSENKSNLACFLSRELSMVDVTRDRELVVAGGFDAADKAHSSVDRDITILKATHEEADTRIILHSIDAQACGYQRIIVNSRDTDVLVLLAAYKSSLTEEVWMKAGTSKNRKYIAIHNINMSPGICRSLIAFHALTGCDSTSQFAGISKKAAWRCLKNNAELLQGFGSTTDCTLDSIAGAEAFVCKLYDSETTITALQRLRCSHFRKMKKQVDKLPPTKDAFDLHAKRAHYQTNVWLQSHIPKPEIPSPIDCGWEIIANNLNPILTTKAPVSTNSVKLVTCGCSDKGQRCQTRQCMCTRSGLNCTKSCKCASEGYCMNPHNSE